MHEEWSFGLLYELAIKGNCSMPQVDVINILLRGRARSSGYNEKEEQEAPSVDEINYDSASRIASGKKRIPRKYLIDILKRSDDELVQRINGIHLSDYSVGANNILDFYKAEKLGFNTSQLRAFQRMVDTGEYARFIAEAFRLTLSFAPKPASDETDFTTGTVLFNCYEILATISLSKFVDYYLAVNRNTNKQYALKVVKRDPEHTDATSISEQLVSEAKTIQRLDEPIFPEIIEVIEHNNFSIVVMEYIVGDTMDTRVKHQGPQSETTVLKWAATLCEALSGLSNGTACDVSCEIYPSNIIIQPDGQLRLLNFGMKRLVERHDLERLSSRNFHDDIASLGTCMRYMLTGTDFVHVPPGQLTQDHNVKISKQLKDILERCIQPDSGNTYEDFSELLTDLRSCIRAQALRKKKERIGKLVLMIAALLAFVAAGYAVIRYVDRFGWSDWTSDLPDFAAGGEYKIQVRYAYKYRKLIFTTSSTRDSIDGWELDDRSISFSSWSQWSEWSMDISVPSAERMVETKVRYRYRDFEETPYGSLWGPWSAWSDTPVGTTDMREVESENFYRYRERDDSTTYYFRRWTEWSDWIVYTEDSLSKSETVDVETQLQYRYKRTG